MKTKSLLLLLFLLSSNLLAGKELTFQAPELSDPYYKILFPFESHDDSTIIEQVMLNGHRIDDLVVLQQGTKQNITAPLKKGSYTFWLDYAWKNGRKYEVRLLYKIGQSGKSKTLKFDGSSPKEGGIKKGKEGFYRAYIIEETVGLERKSEIVMLTFTVLRDQIEPEKLLILDGDSSLEYQIIDQQELIPPEKVIQVNPITKAINIAFCVTVGPYEKKLLLLLQDEKELLPVDRFGIEGEGLGKTIKNSNIALELHPQSGQINTIENLKMGIRLWNEIGVIHWNPGCYIPGIAWDHSFDWNPPQHFSEKSGGLIYINSRKGPLPHIQDVYLEVKYILEKDSPYFVVETRMRLQKDLGAIALRNDEMVLYNKLFDTLIYKTKGGNIIQMPLKEKTGTPFGLAHIAPDDLDWVGLINTEKKYGFFGLRINYANMNLDVNGSYLNQPGTYFYAPSDGKYSYWVRPLYYTWGKHTTNNYFTFIPEGSSFYEKNAYILLSLTPKYEDILNSLLKKLRNPLWIN